MKRVCRILSLGALLLGSLFADAPASSQAESLPLRQILNLTATPATSVAVTWASRVAQPDACVEYALATDGTAFEKSKQSVPATLERWSDGEGEPSFHFSAVLKGLTPGTSYCYRVGDGKTFGEWNQFCTAKVDTQPFSLVWFGDPQDQISEHCSRIFREAFRTAPRASFWLFTGDVCGDPVGWQWGEFFDAAGFSLRMVPSIMTPGNHDTAYKLKDGKPDPGLTGYASRDSSKVGCVWRAHLTLPENGLKGLEETSYYVDYQGLRVIMLNSNTQLAEQAAWLEPLLANNPCRWTIVAFHHPLYNGGANRDKHDTRDAFLPLFDKYKVDLVLTGHDHVYMRSHPLRGGRRAAPGEKGTVYMVSSSGPKFYSCDTSYGELMARTGSERQLFQVIEVGPDKLTVRTHTATGALFDSCEISH